MTLSQEAHQEGQPVPVPASIGRGSEATPQARRSFVARLSPAQARSIAVMAAVAALTAFFLPWMNGDGTFALRTFSGFDFARLIRNFEITAASQQDVAQVRGTAVLFYLAPALLVNSASVYALAPLIGASQRLCGVALAAAGIYALALVALLLVMGALPLSPLAPHVAMPREGMLITVAAATCVALLGRRELRLGGG